jgi:hypothetical protein
MILFALMGASSASAEAPGPGWTIRSVALPSNFSIADNKLCEETEQECDSYLVTATNLGTQPSQGAVVVTDTLPSGLALPPGEAGQVVRDPEDLETEARLECTRATASVQCTDSNPVLPGDSVAFVVDVLVGGEGRATVQNQAEVEEVGGAGAPAAMTSEPSSVSNTLNGEAPSFGIQDFNIGAYGVAGASNSQAGAHPSNLTTTIDYTSDLLPVSSFRDRPVEEPKTTIVDLPLGLVGDPLAAERCPESDLFGGHCPAASQVGTVMISRSGTDLYSQSPSAQGIFTALYDVVSEAGYPAMFGFEFDNALVLLRARVVPSAAGYVLSVTVPYLPRSQSIRVTGATLTFFGDPEERDGGTSASSAFFANPTDCAAEPDAEGMKGKIEMDSWIDPGHWVSGEAPVYQAGKTQAVSGCNMLQFNPTIEMAPEETQADTPSGYVVNLKVPQAPNISSDLATPELKDAEVSLPAGVAVSPGAADGLVACQEAGPEGINITHGWTPTGPQPLDPADPESMEIGPDGLPHVAPGHCPSASQIGTVEIATPLLTSPLLGHVYVAQPLCGAEGQPACTESEAAAGNLFRLYLEVAGSGVIVKLEGKVSANPQTGQLTAKFEENPQLPFSELKLRLNGGARAPLANPQTCGPATTTSSLEPWSAPESGPAATPFSSFDVSGCASPQPFAPGFLAQTSTPIAGAFSPFTLRFSRSDGEQNLSGLTVSTPPGLLGVLKSVVQCPEPQAQKGECGPQSLIGHTQVAAGAGSHPFWESGTVYLTGPYKGQPFGLTAVVPAVAGPFNLGTVIVRAAIHVDPKTSALTVTSDPLPQIIDGVPLRIQTVNVTIDHPGFIFNPTNCSQEHVMGTITAARGASASVSSPFAAATCKNLPFKPKLSATTSGKASKAGGASLDVKMTAKGGPQPGGGEANIKSVKVDLPKQLPSRLTTLQKACTAKVFEANPASCPKESDVGSATASTPVLAHPLVGPAYLVSHGGAAFPDLEIVLQGEGITLILDGNTEIKKGITSSTFRSVPDAPIGSFELTLPEGKYSALGTNLPQRAHYSLCKQTLAMPTAITGQNGAEIHESTPISISGCPKSKVAKKVKAKTGKHGSNKQVQAKKKK